MLLTACNKCQFVSEAAQIKEVNEVPRNMDSSYQENGRCPHTPYGQLVTKVNRGPSPKEHGKAATEGAHSDAAFLRLLR